jgi:cytochrome c peroxidase
MMLKKNIRYILIGCIGFFSCNKPVDDIPDDSPDDNLHYYSIPVPAGFPPLVLHENNPISVEGIALGKRLYYDPILSGGTNSCSSCHFKSEAFSNTTVNSLPHLNLGWQDHFLWNGSKTGLLEDVMMFEVQDFFGTDVSLLQQHAEYPALFEKVFGEGPITDQKIAFALAQFIRTIITSNSKFDRYLRGEVMLTTAEFNGLDIFFTERGDCFHCHAEGLFHDNSFHNIGLDSIYSSSNFGRFLVTGDSSDIGKFKTPTLRNIELTPPYMHDGRFTDLMQVLQFYNQGVKIHQYADPIMTKPGKEDGLDLSYQDLLDLKAFLFTLTDSTLINNPNL